ncbi:MAG: SulP family inorganic anion transporter [Thermodesulfobacteriota bacterium]
MESRTSAKRAMLERLFPFLGWKGFVTRRTVRSDLAAGLTGAVIVLPQGVAFAAIAGLPPEYGLYTAIVPVLVAALFGSSLHLVSGPTTAISLVVFSQVSVLHAPGDPEYVSMVLTLTFMAGAVQLGLGLARLGAVINFVSHSVVVGFTAGAAVLIVTSQLGHFFGIRDLPRGEFLETWAACLGRLDELNGRVLLIATFTLCLSYVLKKRWPRMPAMFAGMTAASLLSLFLNGEEHGVRLVGALPASLPPLSLPDFSPHVLQGLFPGALAIAMLGLAEAVSIARSVATLTNQRIDNSQEFIGQGLSNLVGSFFSAYASSGSFTRTGVNHASGARTPLAAVFSALGVAAILLLVARLTAYLPLPAMAGVIVLVAVSLVNGRQIRTILATSREDTAVLAATFLSTLFLDLEFAIFAGVILSLLIYLNRTSHPHFTTLAPVESRGARHFVDKSGTGFPECPQLKVLRLDGSIFFGAVNHISEALEKTIAESPEQCHILVVASGVNFMDVSGCEMVFHEGHALHAGGRALYLCSVKPEVMLILNRGGCLARVGAENVFEDKYEALAAIVPRLDPERCRECRVRIFLECAGQPGPEHPEGRPGRRAACPASFGPRE